LKNDLLTKVDEALQAKADQSILDFERNQLRLKFLCNDGNGNDPSDGESDSVPIEEKYSLDAKKFGENIKQQFVGFRSKFRHVMNEVRSDHYQSFAKLGIEKETVRVSARGESGANVYKQMEEEVKLLKERLRTAGVNRIAADINAEQNDSEDPDFY